MTAVQHGLQVLSTIQRHDFLKKKKIARFFRSYAVIFKKKKHVSSMSSCSHIDVVVKMMALLYILADIIFIPWIMLVGNMFLNKSVYISFQANAANLTRSRNVSRGEISLSVGSSGKSVPLIEGSPGWIIITRNIPSWIWKIESLQKLKLPKWPEQL